MRPKLRGGTDKYGGDVAASPSGLPSGTREERAVDAGRSSGDDDLVDPVGGGDGTTEQADLRLGGDPLRPATARRHRGPAAVGGLDGRGPLPLRQPAGRRHRRGRRRDPLAPSTPAGCSSTPLACASGVGRSCSSRTPCRRCRPSPRSATAGPASPRPSAASPACPSPRRVNHPPFFQLKGPVVWTTLQLTVHADGTSEHHLTGASDFPRHWVYGPVGRAGEEGRPHRVRRVVPPCLRQAHPVGRRGLTGPGHRGGDGPRAGAGRSHHAGSTPSPRPGP